MPLTDDDLKEFEDAQLRMRVPAYMRQQKKILLFQAPKNRRPGQSLIVCSAFVMRGTEDAEAQRQALMVVNSHTWEDTGFTVVRKGPATWLPDSYELLATTRIVSTGEALHHDLVVLFERDGQTIDARMLGTGDLDNFERLCRVLIDGIQVIGKAGEAQAPAKRTGRKAGGLKRADRARLRDALMTLPPELAYLRKPILAVASEDQELLGAGEGDLEPLVKALRQRAERTDITTAAIEDADALLAWLNATPDHTDAWAAPAWFVEGALRGVNMFFDENQ